jgi:hypothetical protein
MIAKGCPMPAFLRILPEHALVVTRYHGVATIQDGFDVLDAYLDHPERRPGQRHLIDLGRVTALEQNFPRLFELQARRAAVFPSGEHPVMLVYHAPTPVSLRQARLSQRSWEGLDGAFVRVATDWDGAMDILGLRRGALDWLVLHDA